MTLTATPNDGFEFDKWEVVSGGVDIVGDKFTIGNGDVVLHTPLTRALPMELSLYAAATLAIFTAVIVNYFQQVISQGHRGELEAFLEQLERLPELSREELILHTIMAISV